MATRFTAQRHSLESTFAGRDEWVVREKMVFRNESELLSGRQLKNRG